MATGINFNGLGSGIDFSKLSEAILAERARPMTQLQAKSDTFNNRSAALKQLNASLATLAEAANALTNRELGSGRVATSSAVTVATASSASTAAPATLNLTVTRLATSLTQASRVYATSSTAVLAGGATTATFELRKGGAATGTAITIDSANNTLAGLRDAINNANAGVTAAIVDADGSGAQNKLILTSTATGAAGSVQLFETTATGTAADLNLASLNPPGAINDFSALDAAFSINGLSVTRSTNTVSDAVSGVTFELKSAGSSTVTVSANTAEVSQKLAAFINAYNNVQDFIAGQYKKDGKGRPTGVLAGDPTLRTVQQQLREAVSASSTTNGGALTELTQIGLGRDADGKLTLDSAVLNGKLSSSFSDVQALLSGKTASQTGLANSIYDSYNRLSDKITGVVQTAINGYEDSIKTLDRSIDRQLSILTTLRQTLSRQFAAADAAIGQLNGQGTALSNVLKSLEPLDKK
jgi:flagellar hook-associated protein 2